MTAQRYRAVVIGCGRMGSTFADEARAPGTHSHAQAYREHPRTVLVGVADHDDERLAAATKRWGVPGRRDGVSLCRELRPDVVSVCTPDPTHASLIRALLESAPPRLIFAEKPLAESAEEARAVATLANEHGSMLVVNHSRRFSTAFRALGQELRDGVHGRPVLARIMYGKGLRHNGIHAVDLLRLWLGEPTRVQGERTPWGSAADRTCDATLEFVDSRALLEGFDERIATVFEGEVLTERTRWRFWNGGDDWEFATVEGSPAYAGYRSYVRSRREESDDRFVRPLGRCLAEAVANIVAVLDGRGTTHCRAEDAVAALRIVEDIERSAEPPS